MNTVSYDTLDMLVEMVAGEMGLQSPMSGLVRNLNTLQEFQNILESENPNAAQSLSGYIDATASHLESISNTMIKFLKTADYVKSHNGEMPVPEDCENCPMFDECDAFAKMEFLARQDTQDSHGFMDDEMPNDLIDAMNQFFGINPKLLDSGDDTPGDDYSTDADDMLPDDMIQ